MDEIRLDVARESERRQFEVWCSGSFRLRRTATVSMSAAAFVNGMNLNFDRPKLIEIRRQLYGESIGLCIQGVSVGTGWTPVTYC